MLILVVLTFVGPLVFVTRLLIFFVGSLCAFCWAVSTGVLPGSVTSVLALDSSLDDLS